MALFIISVPLMIAAVAIAVVPLVAMSHKHHRRAATVGADAATELQRDQQHDEEAFPIAA